MTVLQNKSIWVLVDEITGHTNQSIALAKSLKAKYIVKKIYYNKLSWLPSFFIGSNIFMVENEISDISPPYPDIVISSGRKLACISRYIKKKSPGTKIIHILWPEFGIDEFDFIIVPTHDNHKNKYGNIINIHGSITEINSELLLAEQIKWQHNFYHLPKFLISVFIGGDTKKGKFNETHAVHLFEKIILCAHISNAGILVSTSRRTDEEVVNKIKNMIAHVPHYFYDFSSEDQNPYLGFLACSSAIIVTGDSISMCVDCCSTGKATYIYSSRDFVPYKHRRFIKHLIKDKYAKSFDEIDSIKFDDTMKSLNNMPEIVDMIHGLFSKLN